MLLDVAIDVVPPSHQPPAHAMCRDVAALGSALEVTPPRPDALAVTHSSPDTQLGSEAGGLAATASRLASAALRFDCKRAHGLPV